MILGIGGEYESGKDTVADYLVNKYGYTKMAFAENLKQMAMKVFNLTHEQCYTTKGKFELFDSPVKLEEKHCTLICVWIRDVNKWKITNDIILKVDEVLNRGMTFETPRDILQKVGTEIMRDCFDPDIHAMIVFDKIKENGYENVAIADARFGNERSFVRSKGGQLVLVDCPQVKNRETSGNSTHRSETSLGDKFEYNHVIVNDKDAGLETLYYLIDGMMETLCL
jgi:hypothetical protein